MWCTPTQPPPHDISSCALEWLCGPKCRLAPPMRKSHTPTHTHMRTHTLMHTHTHPHRHNIYSHNIHTRTHNGMCNSSSCKCRNLLSLHEPINSSILQDFIFIIFYFNPFFYQSRSLLHFTNAVTYKMQEPAPFFTLYTQSHNIPHTRTHAHTHTQYTSIQVFCHSLSKNLRVLRTR